MTVGAFSTIPFVGAGRVGNAGQSSVKINVPCQRQSGHFVPSDCLLFTVYKTVVATVSLPYFCCPEKSVITGKKSVGLWNIV